MLSENNHPEASVSPLDRIRDALEGRALDRIQSLLEDMHPGEIADLLESLPPGERNLVWELVDLDSAGEVLLHVRDEVREGLIQETERSELVAAARSLALDDLADLMEDLPDVVTRDVLQTMDLQNRQRLAEVMSYPEDSAGGLMNTDQVMVRHDIAVEVVLRYLRWRGELPRQTDKLIVIDRDARLLGVLRLSALLVSQPEQLVRDIMSTDVEGIPATMPAREVARLFEQRDFTSAPVVGEDGMVIGRITIDDVVDVIREQAEHSLMSMAGLDEEDDIFAPVVHSARRRAIWLGINLITAFAAAWVIGLFEATIDKIVALAVLMPIVASMGGIAGSQTLTIVIRGLALGHVESANARLLMLKELAVGLLNGLLWAVVVAALAVLWFGDLGIGGIIGAAILINLCCAAISGVAIPMLLERLGIDPALAGSVVLTTVTDVVGFFAFLGLATALLL